MDVDKLRSKVKAFASSEAALEEILKHVLI
jgi:hypothetical protein